MPKITENQPWPRGYHKLIRAYAPNVVDPPIKYRKKSLHSFFPSHIHFPMAAS